MQEARWGDTICEWKFPLNDSESVSPPHEAIKVDLYLVVSFGHPCLKKQYILCTIMKFAVGYDSWNWIILSCVYTKSDWLHWIRPAVLIPKLHSKIYILNRNWPKQYIILCCLCMIKCTEIGTFKISFKMIEPRSIFSNKVQEIAFKLV